MQNLFNAEYQINKDDHNAAIFQIVNKFRIRHNDTNQKNNYAHDIWYDWMMQYYTSVIIAYYKLSKLYEKDIKNIEQES